MRNITLAVRALVAMIALVAHADGPSRRSPELGAINYDITCGYNIAPDETCATGRRATVFVSLFGRHFNIGIEAGKGTFAPLKQFCTAVAVVPPVQCERIVSRNDVPGCDVTAHESTPSSDGQSAKISFSA